MDWDSGYKYYIDSQKITKAMIKEIKRLGYKKVIVDDAFPYKLLRSFLAGLPSRGHIINLFCENDELESRLKTRGRDIIRIKNIMSFNESIKKHDLDNMSIPNCDILYIDNTNKDSNELANCIIQCLREI